MFMDGHMLQTLPPLCERARGKLEKPELIYQVDNQLPSTVTASTWMQSH